MQQFFGLKMWKIKWLNCPENGLIFSWRSWWNFWEEVDIGLYWSYSSPLPSTSQTLGKDLSFSFQWLGCLPQFFVALLALPINPIYPNPIPFIVSIKMFWEKGNIKLEIHLRRLWLRKFRSTVNYVFIAFHITNFTNLLCFA